MTGDEIFVTKSLLSWNFLESREQMLNSAHTLLMILYDRDCRRSFTSQDQWLVRLVDIFYVRTRSNHVRSMNFMLVGPVHRGLASVIGWARKNHLDLRFKAWPNVYI